MRRAGRAFLRELPDSVAAAFWPAVVGCGGLIGLVLHNVWGVTL